MFKRIFLEVYEGNAVDGWST